MGIKASANQIEEFIDNVDSFKSSAEALISVNANLEAAYSLTKQAIKNLDMIADSNFTRIQSDIGYAIHIMKNNEAILKDIADLSREHESQSDVDKSSSKFKAEKAKIDQTYDNTKKKIDALEKLIGDLNRKSEVIQKARDSIGETGKNIDTLFNDIKRSIFEINDYLSSVISDANMAKAFLVKIGEYLSECTGISYEYSSSISIKSSKYLYAMGNSLGDLYEEVNDNDEELYRSINNFTTVFKDQVSTKSAARLVDMLKLFSEKVKDFNKLSASFKDAGDYLVKYESLKR